MHWRLGRAVAPSGIFGELFSWGAGHPAQGGQQGGYLGVALPPGGRSSAPSFGRYCTINMRPATAIDSSVSLCYSVLILNLEPSLIILLLSIHSFPSTYLTNNFPRSLHYCICISFLAGSVQGRTQCLLPHLTSRLHSNTFTSNPLVATPLNTRSYHFHFSIPRTPLELDSPTTAAPLQEEAKMARRPHFLLRLFVIAVATVLLLPVVWLFLPFPTIGHDTYWYPTYRMRASKTFTRVYKFVDSCR